MSLDFPVQILPELRWISCCVHFRLVFPLNMRTDCTWESPSSRRNWFSGGRKASMNKRTNSQLLILLVRIYEYFSWSVPCLGWLQICKVRQLSGIYRRGIGQRNGFLWIVLLNTTLNTSSSGLRVGSNTELWIVFPYLEICVERLTPAICGKLSAH